MRPVGDLAEVAAAVRAAGDIPARVPGCVHTDLMRAGLIPDPRVGTNELDLQWIGETDWEYRASIKITPEQLAHERLDLACDGLDTIAELSLNGHPIGSAANMFHPHRFDLRSAARRGMNELSIIFRSPVKHIRAEEKRCGKLPYNGDGLGWEPFNYIRKAACNFGWDWAPKVATCGVCGPLRVEAWSTCRLASVRPQILRADSELCTIEVHVELEWSNAVTTRGVSLGACIDDRNAVDEWNVDEWASATVTPLTPSHVLRMEMRKPTLWWPRGLGTPHRYGLGVMLTPPDGAANSSQLLDVWESEVGFRTVRLNTDPDEHGAKFQLEINGRPIFCKGANWIPEGLFPDDRPPEKIRERVRQAAAANMNMLRVWGGGVYESDEFYDECDKQGIMVWQDFMFACACYPEEAPFPQLIEAEARHQIARLSTHPSVVLWCGGNECVWGYESWGHAASDTAGPWKQRVGERAWGAGYWLDLLPRLMRELDPSRPYWPNSPWSGGAIAPNAPDSGDRHIWDARGDTAAFRAIVPRFCSEFGHQSPPSLSALAKVVRPEDFAIDSAAMHHRQRGTGGMGPHINVHLAEEHPTFKDFAEWHAAAQTMHARVLKRGLEWLLANQPRCMGALIWQFNDAWPGMSWSLIDSDGTPKPAYYAVQEVFGRESTPGP